MNPDEGIWKCAKGKVANGYPKHRSELISVAGNLNLDKARVRRSGHSGCDGGQSRLDEPPAPLPRTTIAILRPVKFCW